MVHNILFEIILNLLKNKENHVRSIAKAINTTHVTVIRKLEELTEENIVEYNIQGKNKNFRLKDNIQSRNYIIMAELYKTNKIMIKYPKLSVIINEIFDCAGNRMIVLFGSYAKETAVKNSDIDIYIETQDKKIKEKMKLIYEKINTKIGKFDTNNALVKEIIKNHVIINGVDRFYELSEEA